METTPLKPVRQLPPGFRLFRGGHEPPRDGVPLELCFDETVAWMFGEGHTATPQCMCSVLAGIGMRLNDLFDDDERQLLIPLLARCGGTRASADVRYRRAMVMLDASIREIGPMALVRCPDLADRLRAINPIVDRKSARTASEATSSVLEEAIRRRSDYAYAYAAAAYGAASAAADDSDDATAYDAAAYAAYATACATEDDTAFDYVERSRIRSAARRPIVLATIAAFERAIEVR